MKLLDCPQWIQDDDSALPAIAAAAQSFVRFMERQNPRKYILTHGDLKQWHQKLFEKVVPVSYYAGNYREVNPAKPCLETNVHVAGIFGAPYEEVEAKMRSFSAELARATTAVDQFLQVGRTAVARVKAAAQIAAFAGGSIVQIHPFVNGNGRIARLAMNFYLHRYLDYVPFFIDRPTHPSYSTASQIAMQSGNFTPLYQYLVEIIALDS